MIQNIFSSLMHERHPGKRPGVIKEFVLWCVVCFSALLTLIAAAMGGGSAAWIMLLLFTMGMGVMMAFRLTAIVLLYSAGVFQFLIFIMHYVCFLNLPSYYRGSGSALVTVIFILLLLLSLAIVICGFVHFFSRVNLGMPLMIMVVTDSVLIVLFQFIAYLSINYSISEWWNGYMGSSSYWVGTISYWMILTVVSLLYIFFFQGVIDNRKSKIVNMYGGSGRYRGAPGILGVSGAYAGQTIYLQNRTVTIGSGDGVTLKVQDNYVSAEHCAIRFAPSRGCYEIYDNSPYGVYVNSGMPVQKGGWCPVKRGRVISIGNSVQKFQLL